MNVVVFGATSAIVQATLRHWPDKSAEMILVARDPSKLRSVADDLRVRGHNVSHQMIVDFENPEQIAACLEKIKNELDHVGTLFVGAGNLPDQELAQGEFQEAERTMQLNYNGVIQILTGCHEVFAAQKCGTIAVITSVAGDRGRASNFVYASAKAGVSTYLSGLRQKLFKSGVRVVDIRPGFVDTPMTRDFEKGVLWASPDDVGRHIARNLAGKRPAILYTPWHWRWILLVIKSIPEFVFKRL